MMTPTPTPLNPRAAAGWALGAVASFHLAYEVPFCAPFMLVFLLGALQLARATDARRALYLGWAVGLGVYAPQLFFFWSIFHQAAIVLWLILASWLAFYLLLQRFAWRRLGLVGGTLAAPWLWTGLEYFRSELYPLRFSWLNAGYLSPSLGRWTGMYGVGFVLMLLAALLSLAWTRRAWRPAAAAGVAGTLLLCVFPPGPWTHARPPLLNVAGVQFEEGAEPVMLKALDDLYTKHPETSLFVLSEYAFPSAVPPEFRAWCARRQRWLLAGGKEFLDPAHAAYRNAAFVVGPDGGVAFTQAKSRPIQFFDDGLPAAGQAVWNSPWGKIGVCICYDLSYTRVTDALIRQGARAIIVPTMDVQEWGARQHALHARVAPARAAEYGVPIFRLCSSGISQAVSSEGGVQASAPFPGQGRTMTAALALPVGGGHVPFDRVIVWPCMACAALLIGWQAVAFVVSLVRGRLPPR